MQALEQKKKQSSLWLVVMSLCAFLFLIPLPASATIIWNAGMTAATVNEYGYYCEEFRKPDTAEPGMLRSDLLQPQLKPLNLKYLKNRSCWTEFDIKLEDDQPRLLYLEHGLTQADVIRVFHSTDGKQWNDLGQAGNEIPTHTWPVHYRSPTFELKLTPGVNTLRIYQASRDITGIEWKLWEPKSFHRAVDWENLLFGGFFATCLALSLYNLVIFIVSRDSLHFSYFLYLSTYSWVQMFMTGFTKLYLLTDIGPLLGRIGISSIVVSMFCAYAFVGKILEISKFPRLMARTYQIMAWISFSNILLTTVGPFHIAAQNCLISSAIGSIAGFIYGGYALRKRNPMAPLFLIAWLLLLGGTLVQVLALSGVLDNNPLTRSANFIGATVEAILISYALAFKMKRERLDETRRRKHAFSQLEKMVYPHQLEGMQQGQQLESTMPLATSHACVICVDMINSSKHETQDLKDFLRAFFDECDIIMNRGYQGLRLQASGYRIKEMGDGFLCSVGFPFRPPNNSSLPEIALEMALEFVRKFEESLASHPLRDATEPLISIGIAEGSIEGFFTLSGIRSYELFGKGIVLASRYESLRKIYNIPGQGHLLCIRASVYHALPAAYQKNFARFALDRNQTSIRDDEDASDFFYQRIPTLAHIKQSA